MSAKGSDHERQGRDHERQGRVQERLVPRTRDGWPQPCGTRSGITKTPRHPTPPPFGSPPPLSSRVFNINTQIIIFGKK